ncbi:MAG: hypothetical protein GF411_19775 [Candidatus Lokiarchaeota archaeon]|nr:hypothetical protein [Candidatus Lokiarchaeota archaeon]
MKQEQLVSISILVILCFSVLSIPQMIVSSIENNQHPDIDSRLKLKSSSHFQLSEHEIVEIPFVDTHFGIPDGIIDPYEYSINITDADTGYDAYFDHNGTHAFIGVSGDTNGWIGLAWHNSTSDFQTLGLEGADIIRADAVGTTHSSFDRVIPEDVVAVDYEVYFRNGTFIASGTVPSEDSSTPLKDESLLQGYKDMIIGMRVGEIRHFIIPAEDAYTHSGHPLYGEDLEYIIELKSINGVSENPADLSKAQYSDDHGNGTTTYDQDIDQGRIELCNASYDGTFTQVEFQIPFSSNDIEDVPLENSTDIQFPFVLLASNSEGLGSPIAFNTSWINYFPIKFHPNTKPNILIVEPNISQIQGLIYLQVNCSDNTIVREVQYQIDSFGWNTMYHNFTLDMWCGALPTFNYNLGLHDISFKARDASDLVNTTNITVEFIDSEKPIVEPLDDVVIPISMGTYTFKWSVFDFRPHSYIIFKNSTTLRSTSWSEYEISVEFDLLILGVVNFTLILVDEAGNTNSDTVLIEVIEEIEQTDSTSTTTTSSTNGINEFDSIIEALIENIGIMISISSILIILVVSVKVIQHKQKSG